MTGDRRKRKNTLEGFIAALVNKREEFRREKKTGAGCATEAIEFYQFVLGKNTSWKAKAGKKPGDKELKLNEPPLQSHQDDDDDDDDEGDEEGEDEDGDDFLAEHNDICEVCTLGGELLCCATCNLVFHLNCVRPVIKSIPPDTWSCAHCDATGVTGLKKDSRQRKRATAAIREMNKLQHDSKMRKPAAGPKGAEDDDDGDDDDDDDDAIDDGGGDADTLSEADDEAGVKATSSNSASGVVDGDDSAAHDMSNESDHGSCKVCSYGGDLFSCDQVTCPNIFHIACVRPLIEAKPTGEWNCAYCDVDFVTGLKPQARKRRAAISGVRAMDKLKAEYDAKRKEHILPASNINMETPTKLKRKLEDMNMKSSSLNSLITPIHPGQPRSQRLRKQIKKQEEKEKDVVTATVLTDDHSDDAYSSDAENDIAQIPIAPRFTRDDIPPDLMKKLAPRATNSNSRHGQYACKFCMDDEVTETCCFCACRICFTKHHESETILCDLCDGEYHINCLSPPLSQIPSFDWFCPTCDDAIAKNQSSSATKKAAPGKKGSKAKKLGKASSKIANKKGATKAKVKLLLKQKKAAFSAMQPRTNGGRFAPKGENSPVSASKASSSPAPVQTIKRGPGRPPKSATKESPEKKAGRPRKRPAKSTPTSISTEAKPMFSASGGMVRTETQQRSRSGRVVRRKAAYDEREEGDQLMKSTVSAPVFAKTDEIEPPLATPTRQRNTEPKGMPSLAAMLAANTAANTVLGEELSGAILPLAQNDDQYGTTMPGILLDNRFQAVDVTQTQPLPSPMMSTKIQTSFQDNIGLGERTSSSSKNPRRKPGARECMQISRRFGIGMISPNYMEILLVSSK